MKKIFFAFTIFSSVLLVFTGCLKDKGFDNHTYGINDPDTQPPGIGFPRGAAAKTSYGLDISASNQAAEGIVYVNLESGAIAASDVHVTLALNNGLVAAYNTNNNLTGFSAIRILSSTLYNVSLALTIPAGSRNVQVPINVTSTTTLDPNHSYGLGFTISSVDGGYIIAQNLKNLMVAFTIKNKFDGKYSLMGQFYHPVYSSDDAHYTADVEMYTTGPNSVKMYWPDPAGFFHPWLSGGVLTYFGSQEPDYNVDPSTNAVTVQNSYAGAVTFYTMVGSYNNHYDPATKTIYAAFGYNLGGGGILVLGSSRRWIDTLIRTGPR